MSGNGGKCEGINVRIEYYLWDFEIDMKGNSGWKQSVNEHNKLIDPQKK